VRHCDAVIENFRPGHLDKLGLGPPALRAVQPNLVIAHISGYGQTGPDRDKPAFGVIGEAIGGMRHLTDHPPGTTTLPPVRVGVSIGDSVSGLYAAIGVLAALWQRDRTGGDAEGRTIDVALTESVLSLMEGMLPEYGAVGKIKQPTGGGIATAAPTNAYPTADGGWILIAANSEPLFERLTRLMGRPELVEMPEYRGNQARVANAAALDALIGDWSCRYETDVLNTMLAQANVPASKVYTAADIAVNAQFRHREMVREIIDPAFDKPVLHPGVVPRINGSPDGIRWPGPSIGAHSEDILREFLGLDDAAIAALRDAGMVA
jgi:crotonobetainyl-CoA:carnitine CoA-transferase CaiB-like acyl-CoA transferase